MTQAALATRVGVSVDTIRRAEQGINHPRPWTLKKIAVALSVPLETITPDGPPVGKRKAAG